MTSITQPITKTKTCKGSVVKPHTTTGICSMYYLLYYNLLFITTQTWQTIQMMIQMTPWSWQFPRIVQNQQQNNNSACCLLIRGHCQGKLGLLDRHSPSTKKNIFSDLYTYYSPRSFSVQDACWIFHTFQEKSTPIILANTILFWKTFVTLKIRKYIQK